MSTGASEEGGLKLQTAGRHGGSVEPVSLSIEGFHLVNYFVGKTIIARFVARVKLYLTNFVKYFHYPRYLRA